MLRPWPEKFRSALRGLVLALRSERSFVVHLPMAAAVAIAAAALRVTLAEACILGLCITQVIVAEMLNTALEFLSREVTRDKRQGLADALDIASGAVLAASLGAALIGSLIFLYRAYVALCTAP
jgi:diacylglycerol kinase